MLIKKIAKFETTFEDFLLEQQEKKTPDPPDSSASKDQHQPAARNPDRDRVRIREQQRPVTTSSPQRTNMRADRRDTLHNVETKNARQGTDVFAPAPDSPGTARGSDEFIATRPDTRHGFGGLSATRGPLDRFASTVPGSPNNAISQAANGRMLNDRHKMQRPVTSAVMGELANKKQADKFLFTADDRLKGAVYFLRVFADKGVGAWLCVCGCVPLCVCSHNLIK